MLGVGWLGWLLWVGLLCPSLLLGGAAFLQLQWVVVLSPCALWAGAAFSPPLRVGLLGHLLLLVGGASLRLLRGGAASLGGAAVPIVRMKQNNIKTDSLTHPPSAVARVHSPLAAPHTPPAPVAVRGVSWSEVATVPKRKSHRGLDLDLSLNSEVNIRKGWKESGGTK